MFNQNPNVLLHTHWTYDKSWQEYYSKMGVTNQISMQSFSENWGLLFNAIHMNVLPLTHKEVTPPDDILGSYLNLKDPFRKRFQYRAMAN